MNLSIISPAKNESRNLKELVSSIDEVAKKHKYHYELIIVDDHSTDDTKQIFLSLKKQFPFIKLVNSVGTGPGAALMTGFKHARFNTVITLDSDLSHHPKVIPSFIKEFNTTKSDIIIGSRFIPGGRADLPPHRLFFSKLAAKLVTSLTGHSIGDATSGFRIHRKEILEKLRLKNKGFAIHLEIPLKAILSGLKVTELPIHYEKRRYGSSKMRTFLIGPSYLYVLFTELFRHNLAPLFQTSD